MDNLARSLPPLRALLAFEAAARCGSFTAAAGELNVSQPAVSRQVKLLESTLGIDLFAREHRGVVLTDAGRIYYEAIASNLAKIVTVGWYVGRKARPDRVTIYANYGLASYWLMPRLALYQDAHPDVAIVIRTVEQAHQLSTTEPEIAIRFGDGQWSDGEVSLLFKECGFPVCSPGYLEGKAPVHSVGELQHHRLLHIQAEDQPWLDWTGFFRAFGLDYHGHGGPTYNNYTLAIQATLAGQGIAMGWDRIVDDHLRRGWLVRPINEEVATDLGYYTVANRRAAWREVLDNVLDWLGSDTQLPGR